MTSVYRVQNRVALPLAFGEGLGGETFDHGEYVSLTPAQQAILCDYIEGSTFVLVSQTIDEAPKKKTPRARARKEPVDTPVVPVTSPDGEDLPGAFDPYGPDGSAEA